MIDEEMSLAWREAGERLGIRVIAPHELELPNGGALVVEAFLPDFGGPRGVAVVSLEDEARCRLASAGAAFTSQLGAAYRRFDEELFQQTLDDWGWFGAGSAPPIWYTGAPWT
jgi:hypothetical protein